MGARPAPAPNGRRAKAPDDPSLPSLPTPDGDDSRGGFTAARAAATAKVPISAISFGTAYGQVEINGERQPVPADDDSIRRIADLSGGQFYDAASAGQLSDVVSTLGEQIGYETKRADASKPWLIAGTLFAIIAAAGALAIGQRLP